MGSAINELFIQFFIRIYKEIPDCKLASFSKLIQFILRSIIKPTWLNDRDQYLYPNNRWQNDKEFQKNCLTYTLFSNNIQSKHGINYWIPFTEYEVNTPEKFDSHFMTQFITGKLKPSGNGDVFEKEKLPIEPLEFSPSNTSHF